MPSDVDAAKRELVKLLKASAALHGLQLVLTRESTDKEVEQAFRKVALKVHPDKGGRPGRVSEAECCERRVAGVEKKQRHARKARKGRSREETKAQGWEAVRCGPCVRSAREARAPCWLSGVSR